MKSKNAKQHPKISSAKEVFRKNHYNDGDLTFEQWYELSQQDCFYCGEPPTQKSNCYLYQPDRYSDYRVKNGEFIYNGVDRMNNLEHSVDECVPCCKTCNFNKKAMPIKEFRAWVVKVYKHWAGKSK